MTLSELIRNYKDDICRTLHIGYANWDALLDTIETQEMRAAPDFADEQVWTFLLGAIYAMEGANGAARLASLLMEKQTTWPIDKIWFECLPMPPRLAERNTHLDLAVGDIQLRRGTQSGIEYNDGGPICFCECKWYSDISIDVSNDRSRNQLARVIENAICFQRKMQFPTEVHVTLITPQVFNPTAAKSRLYQYKREEYFDRKNILTDLDLCCLKKRASHEYVYPRDLARRLEYLHLHWVSYQSLFQDAPESILKESLSDFVKRFDGSGQQIAIGAAG
jgi:hypothetical protein